MTQSGESWSWPFRLVGALAVCGAVITSSGNCTLAQIRPDTTLGSESSSVRDNVVIKGLSSDQIEGGARRGGNLFHSFQEFNIDEGRAAYFTNPVGIKNMLSRVTGDELSDIQGTLGVLGKANLFLINPNGIIFGPNASLDIGGSFIGTTANGVGLANGDVFSTNLTESFPGQLLNVNPNTFFFNQIAAQQITNQSFSGLEVNPGQSLLLLGSDVNLNRGSLRAPSGRVELGGVAEAGTVSLEIDGNNLSLSFPHDMQRADVSLSNEALVDVGASYGGSIAITARNIDISGGSGLRGDLETGLGFSGAQAGDITLNATRVINIADGGIVNTVGTGILRKGGNISITTRSLFVTDGASFSTSTYGQGDAGSVRINAREKVSFGGIGNDGFPSVALSTVEEAGKGNGGNIDITTGVLEVTDGAQLTTSTFGQGDAGSVKINAREKVSFGGIGSDRFSSTVFSEVGETGKGKGGDIDITTGVLKVTDGASFSTSTYGQGDAGSVRINARDRVSFDGIDSNGFSSAAFSTVEATAKGRGGNIDITTGVLEVTDGAGLSASTLGQGDAGSVKINARDRVSFDGGSEGLRSAAYSSVGEIGKGRGGNIDIATEVLEVTDGAQLLAGTRGQGDAGSVKINARDRVSFDGGSEGFSSAAISGVGETGEGNGGDIDITTRVLKVTDGAQLLASTQGQGDAGSVKIDAREQVSFDGIGSNRFRSAAFSTVEATSKGKGGGINITTGVFEVTNGAGLVARSIGNGPAGDIAVAARSIRLDNQAALNSDTVGGQGNIFLNSQNLLLSRGSNITTDATETATGGNINVDTGVLVALGNSDISANALEGPGGRVSISSQGIFGTQYRPTETSESDITATSKLGPQFSGTVELNTPDVDPSQGLVALQEKVVDVSGLIAQTCPAVTGPRQSKFVVTGRGGMPPNPGEILNTDAVEVNLVTLNPEVEKSSPTAVTTSPSRPASTPSVEAQGWVRDAKGNVVLTANALAVNPHGSWQKNANCQKPGR